MKKRKAFSFDRDGTLIWGRPKGPIKESHLLKVRKLGYEIGGAGGQLIKEQYRDWKNAGVIPDFVLFKGDIYRLENKYEKVVHVGDDITDKKIADKAGFYYMSPGRFITWLREKLSKYRGLF